MNNATTLKSVLTTLCMLLIFSPSDAFISFQGILSDLMIADGTLWCGAGNIAKNCSELGRYNDTDQCCREHDLCPYTFTNENSQYNGFVSLQMVTQSHCECDAIFHTCLQAKPYKENSLFIWSSFFESLTVKCFAYFPCSFDNVWSSVSHRRTGTCFDASFRAMEFDSVFDYLIFVNETLTPHQLVSTRRLLAQNADVFTNARKKAWHCFQKLNQDASENIVRSFESNFDVSTSSASSCHLFPLVVLLVLPSVVFVINFFF